MINKPYFMVDFSASACMFEIRINDYPVIHMNIEGQVSSMIPINFAILETGSQSVSAIILPLLGEMKLDPKAELRFNIKVFNVMADFVFEKQFGEYQSESIGEKKLPIIKYLNSFQAEVPYKLEAWQKGKNLDEVKDIRKKIEAAYNKIIKIIQDKKFDEYKNLISKRENNMAISMYLSKQESAGRIEDLFQDFNSGFKIQPLPKDSVLFNYANNKIAALKKPNGESALFLINSQTDEELMLDIAFYIPEGKEEFEVI